LSGLDTEEKSGVLVIGRTFYSLHTVCDLVSVLKSQLYCYQWKHFLRWQQQSRRTKTANITKDDMTSQHIANMSLCCEVIPSFVIFAVLVLW